MDPYQFEEITSYVPISIGNTQQPQRTPNLFRRSFAPNEQLTAEVQQNLARMYGPRHTYDNTPPAKKEQVVEDADLQESFAQISSKIKERAEQQKMPQKVAASLLGAVHSLATSIVSTGASILSSQSRGGIPSAYSPAPPKQGAAMGGYTLADDADCQITNPPSPKKGVKRPVFKMETTPEPEQKTKKARAVQPPTMSKEDWEKTIKYVQDIDTKDCKEIARIIKTTRPELEGTYFTKNGSFKVKELTRIKNSHKENWGFPVFILKFSGTDNKFDFDTADSKIDEGLKSIYESFIEAMGFPKGFNGDQKMIDEVKAFYDKQN